MLKRPTRLAISLIAAQMLAACVQVVPADPSAKTSRPLLQTGSGYVEPPRAVWDGGRVIRDALLVEQGSYVVQPGDTLRTIGNRTGAGSEAIAAANHLDQPWTIYPGQRLTIPGGRYHVVGVADTGLAIAEAYGVSWTDIVAENGLEPPYVLRMGQRLRLPPAPPPTDAEIAARAAAFDLGIADIVSGSRPALTPEEAPPRQGSFSGRFRWPAVGAITSGFGAFTGSGVNEGIDIAVPAGANVIAAAPGTVLHSGGGVEGLGGIVILDHGGGWTTAYGRLAGLNVVAGEEVREGQLLGSVGRAGENGGPGLHFEIRRNLKPLDPLRHLPER